MTNIDSAVTDWVDAVKKAGGAVSEGHIQKLSAFVAGLRKNGLWDSFDRLWDPHPENETQARTLLIKR